MLAGRKRGVVMTSDECEACSGPVGLLGSPCMACVKARHRAAVTGTLRVRSQGATADGIERDPALGSRAAVASGPSSS